MVKIQLTDEQIPVLLRCLMDGIHKNLDDLDAYKASCDEEGVEYCKQWHRKYSKLYTNLSYQIELHEEDEDDA